MSDLAQERKQFEALGKSYALHPEVVIEPANIAGVPVYWFTPARVSGSEVVLCLHGGGYIYGSIESHRAMVTHIANAIERKMLFVEYSLAPEHPFPAALNDTVAVVRELLRVQPGFQFALFGDSAGGNLAMSTVVQLRSLHVQAPLYQVLISPWVEADPTYPSFFENGKLDPIITREFVQYSASLYVNGEDKRNPLVSPIHNDFAGVNPTLILVGTKEVLRDDSLFLHAALNVSGAHSTLKTYDNVTHVWILTSIDSPESKDTLKTISDFVKEQKAVLA